MKNIVSWQAFSTEQRVTAIEKIKLAIIENDAFILKHNMFSDIAMSLSIQIEERYIQHLYQSLNQILTFSNPESSLFNPDSKKEWLLLINISFSKGKGNLKIEIPDVPG